MAVKAIREGFHTVTPYLMVREAVNLVEFVKQAFGATELFRTTGSAGGLHAEVRIGDLMVMIGGGGAWNGEPMPAAIYLYMDDVDAVYEQALLAGATSITKPADQPYGGPLSRRKGPVRQCVVHRHAQGGLTAELALYVMCSCMVTWVLLPTAAKPIATMQLHKNLCELPKAVRI